MIPRPPGAIRVSFPPPIFHPVLSPPSSAPPPAATGFHVTPSPASSTLRVVNIGLASGLAPLKILSTFPPIAIPGPLTVRGAIGQPPLPPQPPKPPVGAIHTMIATTLPNDWGGVPYDLAPGTTLEDVANAGQLNDYTILTLLQGQTTTLMASTDLYKKAEQIWNDAVNTISTTWNTVASGAAQGAAEGGAIAGTVAIVAAVLSQIGFSFLSDILAALVADIAAAIAAEIATVTGASISIGAATGSTFGYVGAIIGAVIGACIALGNILYGGQHIQISTGQTFSCKDYVQTNLPNASHWLAQNQDKLMGLTPLRFSIQASINLANGTWLAKNQSLTGLQQPPPPDPGSGDALDMVYTSCPGAAELLNRAQFAAAIALVNTTPQHLLDYGTVINPFPGQRKTYWDTNGTPYGIPGVKGQGVYPDPQNGMYQKVLADQVLTWTPGNAGTSGDKLPNGGTAVWEAQYAACPNLVTNGNTYQGAWPDGQGKIHAQTDAPQGVYFLNRLFPALLVSQAEAILEKADRTFGTPAPNLIGTPTMPDGSTPQGLPLPVAHNATGGGGAPLPPHIAPPSPPAPATIFAGSGSGSGWGFGPNLGALQGLSLGFGGFDFSHGYYGAAPPAPIPVSTTPPAPPPPTVLIHGGHPPAAYTAHHLTAQGRLAVQAGYVAKYVSPTAAKNIVSGAHVALPRGTGKYDPNLPLVLEQAVDRIIADQSSTTADLHSFAAALLGG